MHAEVPKKGAMASFKTFIAEYAMIVISILTALGLEHAAQSWHRSHLAHEAEQRIEAELAENLKELRETRAHNAKELKRLQAFREILRDAVIVKRDTAGQAQQDQLTDLKKRLEALPGGSNISYSIKTPTLRREAWEVAVASQAASWIPADQLRRLSIAYAQQRDVAPLLSNAVLSVASPSTQHTLAEIRLGKISNADQYYLISQLCDSLDLVQASLGSMETAITGKAGA